MPHLTIPTHIADILRRSGRQGEVLSLPEQLATCDYKVVKKIVENAGGKWKRGTGHVFPPGGLEKLLSGLEAGQSRDVIADRQAFYTPPVIASDMAMFLHCDGKTVLEPSCGSGNLIVAAFKHGAARVVGIDIDRPTVDATLHALAVMQPAASVSILCEDFLKVDTTFLGQFDRVLMNPPFTKDADLAHIRHAWQFVKPGGRLVALTSPGWTFSQRGARGRFTAWMEELEGQHERLPDATFGRTTLQVVRIILTKPDLTPTEKALANLRTAAAGK